MSRYPLTLESERLRALVRSNVPAFLSGYLRRVAQASAATVVLGACTSAFPPEQELDSPICAGTSWQALEGLSPGTAHESLTAWDGLGFDREPSVIDELGTRCASASDPTACNAEVEAAGQLGGRLLVATDGDVITRYQTPEEVRDFLEPIDTAQEALLLAWHAGYSIACGSLSRSGVREVEGGHEVVATRMTQACNPIEVRRYLLLVSRAGAVEVLQEEVIERIDGVCIGRRPEGLLPSAPIETRDPRGTYFGEVARLEASAVDAFHVLARELEVHGAPASLIEATRAAAQDEVRHAERMGALARRFGAEPATACVEPRAVRPLFEIALENAVEGCVRETYGALVGMHQAMAAGDVEIAQAMREVAEDEARHATLSWEVARWIEPLLSEADRERIARARVEAVLALRAEVAMPLDAALVDEVGLPSREVALALVDELAETIWS